MTVKNENWSIHITGQGPNHGIKYQEVSRVNGSVYRYDYYGPPAPGPQPYAYNDGIAVIEYGNSPEHDDT